MRTVQVREDATAGGFEDLRLEILRRIAPVLRGVGITEHEVTCRLRGCRSHLTVELTGPPVAAAVLQALGVRVLDAVHADGRTFGPVDVVTSFG